MPCNRDNNRIYVDRMNHPAVVSEFTRTLQYGLSAGYEDFIIDFSSVDSVFPNAAVPISGIMDYYKVEKDIDFHDIENPIKIERTRIFDPINAETEMDDYYRDPLNKVWKFNNYDQVYLLVNSFLEELSQIDQFEEGVLNGIEWSLNEIMDNVIQHSNSNAGYIMGQIHKNTKHIAFCIFDTGIGIYNSLKSSQYKPKHPVDALTLCIKEGVTRDKSVGQGNGMFGLYEIVRLNKGALNITSNKAALVFNNNNIKTHKNLPTISFSNGCACVDFQLDYDQRVSIEEVLNINGNQGVFVNYRIEELENDKGEIEYSIREKSQGFGTRKSGAKVRNELINIYNETKQPIIVDFRGVNLISSSFADELLGKLVLHFGFFGFNNVIRLRNMKSIVQSVAQRSISQRMAESLNNNSAQQQI